MNDGVERLLVTAEDGPRLDLWAATSLVANWIEGRDNGDRQTWLVTVYAEHREGFLEAARTVGGVTVEKLEGAGDEERYVLLVGHPGTGWGPSMPEESR